MVLPLPDFRDPNIILVYLSFYCHRFYPQMKMGQILASLDVKVALSSYVPNVLYLKNIMAYDIIYVFLFFWVSAWVWSVYSWLPYLQKVNSSTAWKNSMQLLNLYSHLPMFLFRMCWCLFAGSVVISSVICQHAVILLSCPIHAV